MKDEVMLGIVGENEKEVSCLEEEERSFALVYGFVVCL